MINNNHRSTVIMEPKKGFNRGKRKAVRSKT